MIRRNSFRLGSNANVAGSHKITIRLLDDNEILQLDFQPHHKGQFLMDYVCRQLNIAEKDYFGLRYVDSNKQRHWLDLGKSVLKQLKDMSPFITCLRFKFYPSDPMLLKENVTRYQLILQLRRDMLHGRLYSNLVDMATLASYIIQSELGDFDPQTHCGNYVAEYELISRQTPEFEAKVMEFHQKLKGTSAAESDELFIKKAISLDTYGVDPHPVKDQQGEQVYLGINYTGISTFQGSKKSTHFKWSQITKLNYEAKMFIIHVCLSEDSRSRKKETVGFKCQSFSACKYLWCCAVEQRLFFNCTSSNDIPNSVRGGGLFGTRFRYSGRVQKEVVDDPGPLRATDGVIQRTPLYRSLQRNKTGSLQSSPLQEYGSLPRSNHSAPLHESTRIEGGPIGSSASLPLSGLSSPYGPDHTTPLETLLEDSPRIGDKELDEPNVPDNLDDTVVNAEDLGSERELSNYVNGIGQSECQKELLSYGENNSTSFLSPNLPLLSISEEVEPEGHFDFTTVSKQSRKPQLGLTFSSSVKAEEDLSPNYIISSLLSNPASPETNIERPSFEVPPNDQTLFKDIKTTSNLDDGIFSTTSDNGCCQSKLNPTSIIVPAASNADCNCLGFPEPLPNTPSPCDVAELQKYNFHAHSSPNSSTDYNANTLVDATSFFEPVVDSNEFSPMSEETENGENDSTLKESRINQVTASDVSSSPSDRASGISGKWRTKNSHEKLLSIWKIFLVSLVCVFLAALIVAVLVIETDLDICQRMRRIPEVEFFKNEVYFPFKILVRDKFDAASRFLR